jgi:oligopeptide transport system substrate-binding protein
VSRLRPLLRLFLPVALLLPFLAGCWSRETAVERGLREQVLHRGLGADIADLDPHVITGLPEINVVSTLFEGLVAENPADLGPVPGVAERWTVAADGLTYTFRLRPDARWSNGAPVTAHDFIASWRRVLTPALGADYASMLYVIEGAEAYHKGAQPDFAAVGVTAPDARTLVIRLEHPAPHFLSLLTHPVWYPVHFPALEQAGDPARRGGTWTRPGNLVGNGPFVLREWRPGKVVIVGKSPTYWDAAAVRLNAIHFHATDSVDAEERMFRSGQLHITEALPIGKVDAYRQDRSGVLHISPFLDTYFYRLNVTRPFLNEPKVRRALALALDRTAIVEKITRGGQQPAYSFTPPGTAGYEPPRDFTGGADEARALLAAAGYPGGQGLPAFEVLVTGSGNHRVIAEAVQEMWRRELGVTVNLLSMEQRSLLAQRRTRDYQILRSDWVGDYLDPNSFLEIFTGASGNNHTGWQSSRYDALIYEAARTADQARRHALLHQAETLLLREAPIIPVYHYTTVRLVHPAVRGWHATLLDRHAYKHVWLEP